MKLSRREFSYGGAVSALTALIPGRLKAGLRGLHGGGSSPSFWQIGQRPFASSSPINQLLLASSILTPVLWPTPANQANFYALPKFQIDQPLSSAPSCAVVTSQTGWGNAPQTVTRALTSGFDHLAGDTADQEALSFSPNSNTCISWWIFNRTNDNNATAFEFAGCDIVLDSGIGPSSTFGGSISSGIIAAGCAMPYGALIKEEFTANATINHGILLSMDSSLVNFGTYAPAVGSDGGASNGFISTGMYMAIPPGATPPAGLSPYGLKIFTALQNYGGFVADTGGGSSWYLGSSYNNPANSWTAADIFGVGGNLLTCLVGDAILLYPMLQKVGYPLDGLGAPMGQYQSYGPQTQSIHNSVSNLLRVQRDSDSTAQDIGSVGVPSGLLNTTALTAFCSGTIGRVTKYYGQFSNQFYTPLTSQLDLASAGANAPIIYQSGALVTINGQPAMLFDGLTNYLISTGSSNIWPGSVPTTSANGSLYFNAVIQLTDLLANYAIFGSDASGGLSLRVDATTGILRLMTNTGTTILASATGVTAGVPLVISVGYKSTATPAFAIYVNGSLFASGSTAQTVANGNILIGQAGPTSTSFFKGKIGAFTIAPTSIGNVTQYSIEQGLIGLWG